MTSAAASAGPGLDALWRAATRHPFLDAVREGTVDEAAVDRWLAQDALFVADLLRFQARLLARAPRAWQAVLVGGCSALVDELAWFEQLAAERGLALDVPPVPATVAYAALLERLDAEPAPVALAALHVLERVYLQAWAHAAPSPRYRAYVEHWTAPGFAAYVDALGALAGDGPEPVVRAVLEQEAAFWSAALDPADA